VWRRGGSSLFAWTLTSAALFVGSMVAISSLALYAELHFHDRALIAKWIGGLAPLILLALFAASFLLQRVVAIAARPLKWTASPWAALSAPIILAALAGIAVAIVNRETVRVLDLRPLSA